MFNFLKNKLKEWTQNLVQKEQEEAEKQAEMVEAKEKKLAEEKKPREEVKKEKLKKEEMWEIEEKAPKEVKAKEKPVEIKEEIKEKLEEIPKPLKEEKKGFFARIKEKFEKKEEVEEEKVGEEPSQEIKKRTEIKEVEETKEEKGFFAKVKEKIQSVEIQESEFNERFEELEFSLLENNVAVEVIDALKSKLKENLVGKKILEKELEHTVQDALADSIYTILPEPFDLLEKIRLRNPDKPFVILFFGINGSGKTTTIAKLAHFLQKNHISCVLAAGDTFRAASIEQLEMHANKLNIPIIKQTYGTDPAAVGFDAIQYAKSHNKDCVLIDTAGRMHTKADLLKEMQKIVRVTNPDIKIFIAESITGNDSMEQAKQFHETVGIDATILTKVDVDEKGGTLLSVSHITQKPILFLGIGQTYDDLDPFNKHKFIQSLGL